MSKVLVFRILRNLSQILLCTAALGACAKVSNHVDERVLECGEMARDTSATYRPIYDKTHRRMVIDELDAKAVGPDAAEATRRLLAADFFTDRACLSNAWPTSILVRDKLRQGFALQIPGAAEGESIQLQELPYKDPKVLYATLENNETELLMVLSPIDEPWSTFYSLHVEVFDEGKQLIKDFTDVKYESQATLSLSMDSLPSKFDVVVTVSDQLKEAQYKSSFHFEKAVIIISF